MEAEARDKDEVDSILVRLGLEFRELPREALFRTAKAYRAYRKRGGSKRPHSQFSSSARMPKRWEFPSSTGIPTVTRPTFRT
jgi:hypothetical protein